MSNNIRPEWDPKPANPAVSQGAPANVGGPNPQVIRPEWDPKPANPPATQGAVTNIGGAPRRPNVRGGTDQPTSAGQ